ncbi:hypothetical protein [Kocuria rhizosphaericola]|uniref:hypothetical protein n=1 Tax=Kocuria rhizosphaericola TaxID=3376284 RepID=UPI0037A31983
MAEVLTSPATRDFAVIGHFALPDALWWDEFSTPMASRIAELRREDAWPAGALPVLELCRAEIGRHHGSTPRRDPETLRRRAETPHD